MQNLKIFQPPYIQVVFPLTRYEMLDDRIPKMN